MGLLGALCQFTQCLRGNPLLALQRANYVSSGPLNFSEQPERDLEEGTAVIFRIPHWSDSFVLLPKGLKLSELGRRDRQAEYRQDFEDIVALRPKSDLLSLKPVSPWTFYGHLRSRPSSVLLVEHEYVRDLPLGLGMAEGARITFFGAP